MFDIEDKYCAAEGNQVNNMGMNTGVRQRKNTAAMVISILELIALLSVYLIIGVMMGLRVAQDKSFHANATNEPQIEYEYNQEEPKLEEEPYVEAQPDPVYCLSCGALQDDGTAEICPVCGENPYVEPMAELTVKVLSDAEADARLAELGLKCLYVVDTWESSIVEQKGTHNNSASAMVDGDLETSWQEGADGDGLGESAMLDFGREVEVQMVEMYLGNWRSDDWFYRNNVPSEVDLYCYGAQDGTFETITVANEKYDRTVCWVEFSHPVPLRYLEVYINEVYRGNQYDDTCIAEIVVYGATR